jgi:phosphohistidine phosphatase
MDVYLVRHGDALSDLHDPQRPLSARGRDEVERVAALMARAGVQVGQIWHSGKLRAEETADILGQHLAPPGGVVQVGGLRPNDDVEGVVGALAEAQGSVMLVGHLPFMSRLASLLVVGQPQQAVLDLPTAAVVCLSGRPGRWVVRWLVTPDLAPRR